MAKCEGCRDGAGFSADFTMAFQPIVDVHARQVFAYEALVRGLDGEGALSILSQVDEGNRYAFDQKCRVKAIEWAARLGLADHGAALSINFLPSAVYEPASCIRLTLATAKRVGFPIQQIIFEFTEGERVDHDHVGAILQAYQKLGFLTAIDDFGAGYSGLTLLAKFQPDLVKLDMELIRGIDRDSVRRALVEATVRACGQIGVAILAEGIETEGEAATLGDLGVRLMQGYLYAKPAVEQLPIPRWTPADLRRAA